MAHVWRGICIAMAVLVFENLACGHSLYNTSSAKSMI